MTYFRPESNAIGAEAELQYLAGAGSERPRRPGNAAANHVSSAVSAVLAGRWNEFEALVAERTVWLEADLSSAAGDCDSAPLSRAKLLSALAVARWLLGRPGNCAAWREAADAQSSAMRDAGVYAAGEDRTHGLDDLMGCLLSARQFREAVDAYEAAYPNKQPAPASCRTPRQWAFVAAVQHLESRWSAEQVHAAGRKMLHRYLDDPWLGRGQGVRGAMWLALVHTPAYPGLSPEGILMQAYDDLPCGWPSELEHWRQATT